MSFVVCRREMDLLLQIVCGRTPCIAVGLRAWVVGHYVSSKERIRFIPTPWHDVSRCKRHRAARGEFADFGATRHRFASNQHTTHGSNKQHANEAGRSRSLEVVEDVRVDRGRRAGCALLAGGGDLHELLGLGGAQLGALLLAAVDRLHALGNNSLSCNRCRTRSATTSHASESDNPAA